MVVQMATKIPDGKFPSDWPFTIFSKTPQFTERDEEGFDPQDRGEELKMVIAFSTRIFRLEALDYLSRRSISLKMFQLVELNLFYHLHSDIKSRNFLVNGQQFKTLATYFHVFSRFSSVTSFSSCRRDV